MVLSLPVASCSEEGIFLAEVQMRFIHLLQALPGLFALCRGHFRVIVNDVLELIHHTAVGDEVPQRPPPGIS